MQARSTYNNYCIAPHTQRPARRTPPHTAHSAPLLGATLPCTQRESQHSLNAAAAPPPLPLPLPQHHENPKLSCRLYEDITCIHTRTSRLDGHLLVRPAGEAEAGGRGPLPPLAGGAELLSDLQHDDHDEHVGREEEGVEEEHVQGVGEHAEGRGEVGGERRGAPEVVEHGEVDDLIEEVEVQPALLEGGDRPDHGVARLLHDESQTLFESAFLRRMTQAGHDEGGI